MRLNDAPDDSHLQDKRMAINILVTEDESIVRKDIERCLGKLGYNVVATADNDATTDAQEVVGTASTDAKATTGGSSSQHDWAWLEENA